MLLSQQHDGVPLRLLVIDHHLVAAEEGEGSRDVLGAAHPLLAAAAVKASRVLRIPVLGLDLLVASSQGPEYVIVDVNASPSLDTTAGSTAVLDRYLDLLFPETALPIAAR